MAKKKLTTTPPQLDAADALLNPSDLLGGKDELRAIPVVTTEWKGITFVYVAELSGDERDEFETAWANYKQALEDSDDNVGFRAFTVAYHLCDADRNRLFAGREDVAAQTIGTKRNGKATSRVFNAISQLNGLTQRDIDELEGNSVATRPVVANSGGNGGSPSGSGSPAAGSGSDKSPPKTTPS